MPSPGPLPPALRALFSFAGALIGLGVLFTATMVRQFGAVDWRYFWFGLWRIALISLGVAAVMYLAGLRSRRAAALFGAALGFAAVLAYYYAVVARP